MRYIWFVALRFLREGRLQTTFILAGVALGVAVIVFLSALLQGLKASLIEKTLGTQAHVVIQPPEEFSRPARFEEVGKAVFRQLEKPEQRIRSIANWPEISRYADRLEGVEAVSPIVNGSGFAVRGRARNPVTVMGVVPDAFNKVIAVADALASGEYRLGGGDVLIGIGLAEDLGVEVGDKIRVTGVDERVVVCSVRGIFDLGVRQINKRWALLSLRQAQTLFQVPGGVTHLELRIKHLFRAERLAQRIGADTQLEATSWMETNADLLVALKGQSNSGSLINVFVILAVTLGIGSVLIVSVVQKSREIGILRATGTTAQTIRRIFLAQGLLVGGCGAVLGCIIGTLLASFFQNLASNPDGSPIFPIRFSAGLYLTAWFVALGVGLIGAYLPARRAAALEPAEVIRRG